MSMNNKSKILMIGPDYKGGITSVINLYTNFGLNTINLISYRSHNIFMQIFVYIVFLFKYIFTLCTNKNIRLVHIHSAGWGSFIRKYYALRIAKLFRKKIIFHIHGAEFDSYYNNSSKGIKNAIIKTLNESDAVIVLSEEWKKRILNICPNSNIKILYNPCCMKEQNKIITDKINILFMGRIEKRKGIYEIIEGSKYLDDNIIINLYGDGDTTEFEKLIEDNKLQNKIKIKGWVSGEQKDEAYCNSDILILPSFDEGLPMSILEAMAYALPIISTPVGGISEAVEEGINGFLVPPGDAKALAEKINLIANDKGLREKMGQESYRIAKEKFDINVIIKQLKEIYAELIK